MSREGKISRKNIYFHHLLLSLKGGEDHVGRKDDDEGERDEDDDDGGGDGGDADSWELFGLLPTLHQKQQLPEI